jgi:predicted O-methyltransferase YrrM
MGILASWFSKEDLLLAEAEFNKDMVSSVYGHFSSEDARAYRAIVRTIRNGAIAELGVYMGRSATTIAPICKENECRLYCVDSWNEVPGHKEWRQGSYDEPMVEFNKNIAAIGCQDIVEAIRMNTNAAAELVKQRGLLFDLVFIDASHEYADVKKDIAMWSPLVKPGGFIMGHDYCDRWESVRQAVDESFDGKAHLISGWVWGIKK